jgi:hypothetical protein
MAWTIDDVLKTPGAALVALNSKPDADQDLWDDVAIAALNGCLSYSHCNEAWGDYHNNGSNESLMMHCADYADAFMAERANRMKP